MRNKVALLLCLTLLIMGLLPFSAALFFTEEAFLSQERIYKNQNLSQVLEASQDGLKKLSRLEPENEANYKSLFEEIQDLKLIYGEDPYFSETLNRTISKYFFVGFGLALVLACLLGVYLSYRINRIYKEAYEELQEERDLSKYLEEIARWQDVAKKMAHEMARPLQPIATWVSNLKSSYALNDARQFEPVLSEAAAAIEEEVGNLKMMVGEFSKFAEMPKPKRQNTNLSEFLKKFTDHYSAVWESVHFLIIVSDLNLSCPLDPMLMRQVLTNTVENAVEANPHVKIEVELSAYQQGEDVILEIFNSGKTLSTEQREKVFDLYFSTKQTAKNMGLGLSIVKLAVLEHGGEIKCVDEPRGVRFKIVLPKLPGAKFES